MTRQDFYLNLALELNNLKVPPELINTHIEQFKTYLQTLTEEEAEKQIASFGSTKDLAANIYKLLCGDAPDIEESTPDTDTVYDPYIVDDEDPLTGDAPISDSEDQPREDTEIQNADELLEIFNDIEKIPTENEVIKEDFNFDVSNPDDYVKPDLSAFDQNEESLPAKTDEKEDSIIEEIDIDSLYAENTNKIGKGSVLFWVLSVITLPITLPLFIFIMALFGFAYLTISLVVSVTFTSIFACAVAGGAVTLMGIVNGIMQLKTGVFQIGLYEIGLSISIVGITLIACIILYLLSLKLLPKLFKYLTQLLKLFLNGLLTLIAKIQKECAAK